MARYTSIILMLIGPAMVIGCASEEPILPAVDTQPAAPVEGSLSAKEPVRETLESTNTEMEGVTVDQPRDPERILLFARGGPLLLDVWLTIDGRPHDEGLASLIERVLSAGDTDGDGRFDTKIVFADRMMFPEGVLWHDGSVYVAAPPSIWKLTDTDSDGVADEREEWFQGKTLTGCANDLHGPYLGPDGWIYWCKGAFAKQIYQREGRPPFETRAAHIFRRHPDGGEVEAVMTGGMDNPVEVIFTPGGERIGRRRPPSSRRSLPLFSNCSSLLPISAEVTDTRR